MHNIIDTYSSLVCTHISQLSVSFAWSAATRHPIRQGIGIVRGALERNLNYGSFCVIPVGCNQTRTPMLFPDYVQRADSMVDSFHIRAYPCDGSVRGRREIQTWT